MEDIVPSWEDDDQLTDAVGRIASRWREIRPELDPSPMLIIGRLGRLTTLIDAVLRPPFEAAGIANGDFDLLAALRRQPGHELGAGSLAAAMLVTTGAATKRIDRLESQGLVTRRVSSDDGRARIVALTKAGVDVVDRLMPVHLANEAALLAPLPIESRRQLARLLAAVAQILENDGGLAPGAV